MAKSQKRSDNKWRLAPITRIIEKKQIKCAVILSSSKDMRQGLPHVWFDGLTMTTLSFFMTTRAKKNPAWLKRDCMVLNNLNLYFFNDLIHCAILVASAVLTCGIGAIGVE